MPPLSAVPADNPVPVPPVQTSGKGYMVVAGLLGLFLLIGASWYLVNQKSDTPEYTRDHLHLILGILPFGTLFDAGVLGDDAPLAQVIPNGMPGGEVVDGVVGGDTAYYLVASEDGRTSNLYAYAHGVWKPLTSSMTMKYDLSYDPISGTFAYLSSDVSAPLQGQTLIESFSIAAWNVTVLAADGSEIELNVYGTQPRLLPGGRYLALTNAGTTVLVDRETNIRTELLGYDGVFAISRDGTSLAIYNRVTGAIDLYELHASSVSYTRSQRIEVTPAALVYTATDLLVGHTDERGIVIQSFTTGETLKVVENPLPDRAVHKLTMYP